MVHIIHNSDVILTFKNDLLSKAIEHYKEFSDLTMQGNLNSLIPRSEVNKGNINLF